MKYLGKTFVDNIPDWKSEELVFNAIAWNEGYRIFSCSRDLSAAMKKRKKENLSYTWLCTTMHLSNKEKGENIVIRKNPTRKIINN